MGAAESIAKFTYRMTAEGVDLVKQGFADIANAAQTHFGGAGASTQALTNNLDKLTHQMAQVSSTAEGLRKIGEIFVAFESAKIFAETIKGSLEATGHIGELAKETGLTTQQFQELTFALKQYGITQDDTIAGIHKLNVAAADFVTKDGGPGKDGFLALGFSQSDVQQGLKNTDQFVQSVLQRMGNLKSEAQKLQIAQEIFGKGTIGAEFVAAADAGIQHFRALRQEAEQLGLVLSDQVIEKAHDADNKLNILGDVFKTKLAVAIADNAGKIDELSTLFIDHMPEMIKFAENLATAFGYVGTAINQSVGFFEHFYDQMIDRTMAFGGVPLPTHMGGTGRAPGLSDAEYAFDSRRGGQGGNVIRQFNNQMAAGGTPDFNSLMGISTAPGGPDLKIGDGGAAAKQAADTAKEYEKLTYDLHQEIAAAGMGAKEHAVLTEQLKLGVHATDQQKDAIGALAGQLYEAQQNAQAFKEAGDDITNAFNQMAFSGGKFSDVLKQLGIQLLQIAEKRLMGDSIGNGIDAIFNYVFGGGVDTPGSPTGGGGRITASGIPVPGIKPEQSFAVGTDYVPHDMIAQIHEGEKITPAAQNKAGSGMVVNIDARGADRQGMADLQAMVAQLNGRLNKVNSSIETRAVSAVANTRNRSLSYLTA